VQVNLCKCVMKHNVVRVCGGGEVQLHYVDVGVQPNAMVTLPPQSTG